MAITVLYQFGSYTYPKCTITMMPKDLDIVERRGETPGRHGDYSQGGLRAPRNLRFSGMLLAAAGDEIEDLWDDFLAAHEPGQFLPLFYGRADRYYLAEVNGLKEVRPGELVAARAFDVSFKVATPFELAATESTADMTSGATVTDAGKQPAPAKIELVLSAGGGGTGLVTITNTTTGKSCTLKPGTNLTPTIYSETEQVATSAGVDITHIFAGTWPTLAPGSNTLTIAATGGAVLTSADIFWRGRW